MATLPTIPLFPFEDSNLANLQALSSAVAFLSNSMTTWHYAKSGSQAMTANTAAAVTYGSIYLDRDSDHVFPGATINTQGYYDCEATVPFNQLSTASNVQIWFQVTTGANNPLGSGVTLIFGYLSEITTGNSLDECSLTISDTSPCLYPGDQVAVWLEVSSALTVSPTWNASGNDDLGGNPDGGCYFTGQLASLGP